MTVLHREVLACLAVGVVSCQPHPAERLGARGRIVGYLFDGETGAPLTDVTITTSDGSNALTVKTKDGFFMLDRLIAGALYRVSIAKEGYVTRFSNLTVPQAPADAYDVIPVANLGALQMLKPSGVVKGRAEFITAGQSRQMIANASVIMDLYANGAFELVKTATTSATGEFTIDGLPSLPTGLSLSICLVPAADARLGVVEFQPLCTNVTVYSGQPNFVTLRPSRTDQNAGDINIVQGVVRDLTTSLPIAGVQVAEVGLEANAVTTDSNGFFFYRTESVNRFTQFVYKKTGYADGWNSVTLTRGGNVTLGRDLYPGAASVKGRLLYANLMPANNAEVRVDLRSSLGVSAFKQVRTNATGDFTITDLPGLPDGLNINLIATPWSADPELFPETAQQTFGVTLFPGAETPALRQLTSVATLGVVANNAYSGFVAVTEPLKMLMSLPTIPAENQFTLTETITGNTMPHVVEYSDSNRLITIRPVVGSSQPFWAEARTYNLNYRVRANNGPNGISNGNIGFTPRGTLGSSTITGRVSTVTIDTPEVDAITRIFTLRWTPVPDAFRYAVYARTSNTNRQPSFVRLFDQVATASPSASINLNNYNVFSSVIDPVSGQAFAFGQRVVFMVVPIDARGVESDPTKGGTIELSDNTPPRFDQGVAQLDDATGGSSVRFVMRATEQLDRANAPTVTLPAGLTFEGWAVDELSGGIEGTLTAKGSASSPVSMTVQLKDTSGNLSAPLTVPVFGTALIPNHGFEGSSGCAAAGWTADVNTTCGSCASQALAAQPAAVTAVAGTLSSFEGRCALSFGDPDAMHCGAQSSSFPITLTGTALDRRSITLTGKYWSYGSGNYVLSMTLHNAGNTNIGTVLSTAASSNQRTWQTLTADLTALAPTVARVRLAASTAVCNTRNGGFQVDDLRLWVR